MPREVGDIAPNKTFKYVPALRASTGRPTAPLN